MLRVLAGNYKGRKIATDHLRSEQRPSLARIRETLFNWLHPELAGARCLDAFAGSGALGLESLSRGAQACAFIDSSPANVAAIQRLVRDWGIAADRVDLQLGACPQAIERLESSFDIVFLDPPFDQPELVLSCLQRLEWARKLNPGALVYVEMSLQHGDLLAQATDLGWSTHRQRSTSSLIYALLRWQL